MKTAFVFGLCYAADAAPSADLRRARTKVPRKEYKAAAGASTAAVLNSHLQGQFASLKPCTEWTVSELQELQASLWSQRSTELAAVYEGSSDRRSLSQESLAALQEQWSSMNALAARADADTQRAHRDGHCHEAVMWLVHHLDEDARQEVATSKRLVPSLPVSVAPCNSEHHPTLCSAVEDQHTCMYCHSTDEGSGQDVPIPDHQPGKTDTFPVFPKRWVAQVSGWAYYNNNGTDPPQDGSIYNQTMTMKYIYDWPNNRVRQDTEYNSSTPSRSGITWFNGTNQKWYIVEKSIVPLCIVMPPPILTIDRPDWVLAAAREMPGNGTYVGQEDSDSGPVDHWRGTFYRENPEGMHSNASFDIWLDRGTSHIKKLVGRCDPPDQQEGSPTLAMAYYDSFEEVAPDDSLDEYFDGDAELMKSTKHCIPVTPGLSSQVAWRAPGIPQAIAPLHTMEAMQEVIPRVLEEYGFDPSLVI